MGERFSRVRATIPAASSALASLLLSLSACAEPLEFADWTIPVPEGTRVIEYAAVPVEERTERIEVVEELVLGDRAIWEIPGCVCSRQRTALARKGATNSVSLSSGTPLGFVAGAEVAAPQPRR